MKIKKGKSTGKVYQYQMNDDGTVAESSKKKFTTELRTSSVKLEKTIQVQKSFGFGE